MKVYTKKNVYDVSKDRIRWIFKEFKGHVLVSNSGGKDSTTILEIALEVVRELQEEGLLPSDYRLKTFWLDQEAEWTHTVEYMERLMNRPELEVYWLQLPFDLGTNTSLDGQTKLRCYDPLYEGEYIQPISYMAYDRLAINEDGTVMSIDELNEHREIVDGKWVYHSEVESVEYNMKSFFKIFAHIESWIGGGESYGVISGIKASESPKRMLSLTYQWGWRGITWCSRSGIRGESVRFNPIYDWSRTDNFTYFGKSKCDYNRMYDEYLRYGRAPGSMRVSSLIHETSVAHNVPIAQEIDPDVYNRMANRLPGISTYSQIGKKAQEVILPPNFMDYEEFGRYLIDKLIAPELQKHFYGMYELKYYKECLSEPIKKQALDKIICQSILTKDIENTKIQNTITAMQLADAGVEREKNNDRND